MKTSLDAHWFEKYKSTSRFGDIPYLRSPDITEQKELFLSGKIDSPVFSYPRIARLDLDRSRRELLELSREIDRKERNEVIREAYEQRIKEDLLRLDLLEAVKKEDDIAFMKCSEALYGRPRPEIFQNSLAVLCADAERVLAEAHSERAEAAERFLERVRDLGVSLENNMKHSFVPLVDIKDRGKILNAAQIAKAFSDELSARGLSEWRVEIKEDSFLISISHAKKLIRIPKTKRLSEVRTRALVAHEIDTHILRRENGARSKFSLLSVGLGGYLRGEEGLAAYREVQIVGGETVGAHTYVLISLFKGLAGKAYTFREAFELMHDFYLAVEKTTEDRREREAREHAWRRVYRVVRGAQRERPGVCLTRDLIYREGYLAIRRLIRDDSPEQARFDVGKYDPANRRHREILDALGIGMIT